MIIPSPYQFLGAFAIAFAAGVVATLAVAGVACVAWRRGGNSEA
jgi:hypothetical protein